MPRTERPRRVRLTAAVAIVLATTVAVPVHAQGGVLLQGIVDGEAWSTSATSNLLTRAGGHPAGLGRLTAWGAWEPFRAFVLYAEGELETGGATTHEVTADHQQVGLTTTDEPPPPGSAHVYRVTASQQGQVFGGYTVVLLG